VPKRLTDQERIWRSVSERDLQATILELAHRYQWMVAHFRPALTEKGRWLTAVAADGAGFPDLVMVRGRRCLFAEIKRELGRLSPPQKVWLDRLAYTGNEVYIWKPSDLPLIEEILKQ
jgi:hypothetical protein